LIYLQSHYIDVHCPGPSSIGIARNFFLEGPKNRGAVGTEIETQKVSRGRELGGPKSPSSDENKTKMLRPRPRPFKQQQDYVTEKKTSVATRMFVIKK